MTNDGLFLLGLVMAFVLLTPIYAAQWVVRKVAGR